MAIGLEKMPGGIALSDQRKETLAERVLGLRTARGLTQAQLGMRMGMSAQAVSLVERGVQRTLPPRTLRAYAQALNVDEDFLREVFEGDIPEEARPIETEEWLRRRLDLRSERHKNHLVETYRLLRRVEEYERAERELREIRAQLRQQGVSPHPHTDPRSFQLDTDQDTAADSEPPEIEPGPEEDIPQ